MKKLLVCLLAIMMAFGVTGCGEKNGKIVVGICQLAQHQALDAATKGFMDVLTEEFGDQIVFENKNASGDSATCATICNGFVVDGVDLIFANATPALQAAASATDKIPVLGTSITEYGVALGIDDFSGIVGGNVSGTSDLAPLDEQAQMILDLLPETKTVGLLFCSSEPNSKYQVKVVGDYLTSKGIKVEQFAFVDSNDIAAVTAEACSRCDVLYIPTDNEAAKYGENINNVALENNTPIITGEENTAILCGIATLTIDYEQLGRTTGEMAVRILKGEANTSEMPVQYFENPVKKFNRELCEKYGIDVPADYIEMVK